MGLTHEIENNSDSQQHLDENLDKFSGDVKIVLQLLYSGHRLSAKDVVVKYGLHDRRLRDAIAALPNIVKKEWVLKPNGKRDYVVYYIEKQKPPTKKELQNWFSNYQNEKPIYGSQQKLF